MPSTAHSPSPVWFTGLRARKAQDSKIKKIERLFIAADFAKCIGKESLTAIKLHFGERGNDTFLNPVFVRTIVDKIKEAGGKPYLTDTNTLYNGSRHNAIDHLHTALEHGFSFATVNAPILIADGLRGSSAHSVPIKKKHFASVVIADGITSAQSMIVLSHFKGHELAGFGGAIKNLAMGCAPSQGKCDQHSTRFFVEAEKCVSCGLCFGSCPEKAISFVSAPANEKKIAFIDEAKCVGCGECLTVCEVKAIDMKWETGREEFTERMVEYAYGAVAGKEGRVAYINFLINITPDCDCVPWSDTPLVPDIGILASRDPVALDKACYDLVNAQQGFAHSQLVQHHAAGEDKFKGAWKDTIGELQLSYAESLKLGSTQYTLIEI